MTEPTDGQRAGASRDSTAETRLSAVERREAIESQLAVEVSAESPIGAVAACAEALREARELATTDPEQAAPLVPDIARTVLAVTTEYHSKGRSFLLGSYEADIRRDGMAALEELGSERIVAGDTTRLDRVISAVVAVLETDPETTAHQHALVVLSSCGAALPRRTADRLQAAAGKQDGVPDFSDRVEATLVDTTDSDRLIAVLQSLAVLASYDQLRELVSDLSRLLLDDPERVLGELATEMPSGRDAFLVQGWLHVVATELFGRSPLDVYGESPVDISMLRQLLETRGYEHALSDREALLWWLLAEADSRTIQERYGDFATLLQKPHAPDGLIASDRYPNTLLDTPSYVASCEQTLGAADSSVRVTAARTLLRLANTEGVTTETFVGTLETLGAAVDTLSEVVTEADDAAVRRRAASCLAIVAEIGQCEAAHQATALDGLCRCARDRENEPAVRREAIRSTLAVVDGMSASHEDVDLVVDTLAETASGTAETRVRTESVRGLLRVVRRCSVTAEQRDRAVAAVTEVLTTADDTGLRLAAAESIVEDSTTDAANGDPLEVAVRELADIARDHDPLFHDFQAVWQLVRVAQRESRSTGDARLAITALEDITESNGAASVRTLAAWGLYATAHRPSVTSSALGQAMDALNECMTESYSRTNPLTWLLGTPGLLTMEAAESLELPEARKEPPASDQSSTRLRTARRLVDLADTPVAGPGDLDRARALVTDVARDGHSSLSTYRVIGIIEGLASFETVTPELLDDAVDVIVDIIETADGESNTNFPALECLGDLAEHDVLPTASFESVHDGFLSGLEPSNRDPIRRASADGFQRFCRAHPDAFAESGVKRCARYSAHLTPDAPAISRNLLAGFRAATAFDAAALVSIRDDIQPLMADDIPVEVQLQALEISSVLPDSS
jgi:hypothetical protein